MNVRGKLAGLNHRLTRLEREVEFLEVALTGKLLKHILWINMALS